MTYRGEVTSLAYATAAERRFDELAAKHPGRTRDAVETLHARLQQQQILFGGSPLPTNIKPHFLPKAIAGDWVQRAEQFTALLEKLATNLASSGDRLLDLGFSREALDLFSIDPGYQRVGVSARPDALWRGESLYFIEHNSDSPAMMTYTDRLQDIARELFPLRDVVEEFGIEFPNRTRMLLEVLLDCYREAGGTKVDPCIAIIDWPNQKTRDELLHTAMVFRELGHRAFVCNPHELSLRGGKLVAHDREIDIVQRRVLFPEVIERGAELLPLLKAYRDRAVVMVNSLRSYLVGSKGILALLHDPASEFLTKEEVALARSLIPHSRLIDAELRRELRDAEHSRWVLKPAFGHGGHAVVLGSALTRDEWLKTLDATHGSTWIAQRELVIPTYRLPYTDGGSDGSEATVSWRSPFINWTPWIFGGRFAGGTSRCSSSPKVSITQNGALLPALASE